MVWSSHPIHLCIWCLWSTFFVLIRWFIYRSDPTENDSVEGLRPNARGPGLVTFGVCILLFTMKLLNWILNIFPHVLVRSFFYYFFMYGCILPGFYICVAFLFFIFSPLSYCYGQSLEPLIKHGIKFVICILSDIWLITKKPKRDNPHYGNKKGGNNCTKPI